MRGIVRAEGWAEADEAEAQQNPVAKREHGIILGHAPSRILCTYSAYLAPAKACPLCRVCAEYGSSMAAYDARLDAPFNCQ